MNIKFIFFLFLLLPAFAQADCYSIADASFPKGDWGMLNREGILREMMCNSDEIRRLEGQLNSNHNSYSTEIEQANQSIALANKTSLLLDGHFRILNKWKEQSSKCHLRDIDTVRLCIILKEQMPRMLQDLLNDTKKLISEIEPLLPVGNFERRLRPYQNKLSAHFEKLKILQQKLGN